MNTPKQLTYNTIYTTRPFLWDNIYADFPVLRVNPEFDITHLPIRFQVIEEQALLHIANRLDYAKHNSHKHRFCEPTMVIVSAKTESREFNYWLSEFLDYLVATKSELLTYIDYHPEYPF